MEVDVTKIFNVEVAKEGDIKTEEEEEEEEADFREEEGTRIKEVEDQKRIITNINNLLIPQYADSIQHNIR